ncbi:MAG: hypothetical protein FJ220_00730 [Kiritimatiellaceae bacterium]|nr:hypothetical protein [Kiritimatiellaceae bacterium]
MKNLMLLCGAGVVLLMAGCKTTEQTPVKPVSWKKQSAYLATVTDPPRYGYSIYQTPNGIRFRDGYRFHPNQGKSFSMIVENPVRPAIRMVGMFGLQPPVLLDFSMSSSWMEFDTAKSLGAIPVSEGEAQLIKRPDDEIPACLSLIPTQRLGTIMVENPLVYVRMANGSLGSIDRGIWEPELKAVVGWELLRNFENIELNYVKKTVTLTTVKMAYRPDPAQVVAQLPLVKSAGVCAVRGTVDGKSEMILIDPAGDFEVATDEAKLVTTVQLSEGLVISNPGIAKSPGGTRIGARILQNYRITICPKDGMIYFEKPLEKEDEKESDK